jgi:ribonuclease BN (tRNA processing enzyme)
VKEKLTILGSGVGAPGLVYENEIRHPPGYLLEKNNIQILIDCSEGMDARLTQVGIDYESVSTIFISHFHPDHFQVANFIFSSALKRYNESKVPLQFKIIGPKGVKENFWTIWNLWWKSSPGNVFGKLVNLEFVELGNKDSLKLSSKTELKAFSVSHERGLTTALAMRMDFEDGFTFAYSGDSGVCKGLFKAAESADVFLCEISANIGEDKSKTSGHLNPSQAGQVAAKAKVKIYG